MVNGWIDIHGHFSPPASEDVRRERWEAMRRECFVASAPFTWSPQSTLDYLDRAGIAMQMLSNVPTDHAALRASNDYGASVVSDHPTRFGLLAALPTDDADAALAEIDRAERLGADGFAVTAAYREVFLGDRRLEPIWAEIDRRRATVFVHPNAYAPATLGRPSPLIDVAFETARSVVDMLYAGVFRRYPHMRVVVAHAGGALPALSGRLQLLGAEEWVPNPERITREEIREHLARLYLDTAATGADSHLAAAVTMVPREHLVYGTDCGVPCSTEATMDANLALLQASSVLDRREVDALGWRAFDVLPSAAARHHRLLGGHPTPADASE